MLIHSMCTIYSSVKMRSNITSDGVRSMKPSAAILKTKSLIHERAWTMEAVWGASCLMTDATIMIRINLRAASPGREDGVKRLLQTHRRGLGVADHFIVRSPYELHNQTLVSTHASHRKGDTMLRPQARRLLEKNFKASIAVAHEDQVHLSGLVSYIS